MSSCVGWLPAPDDYFGITPKYGLLTVECHGLVQSSPHSPSEYVPYPRRKEARHVKVLVVIQALVEIFQEILLLNLQSDCHWAVKELSNCSKSFSTKPLEVMAGKRRAFDSGVSTVIRTELQYGDDDGDEQRVFRRDTRDRAWDRGYNVGA
ncbi:hypothetical protein PIB30_036332 [Stylosanthes scabra]|uniref:Uncharacterized protein n=1 Tax=Stylosanthes scabra TaxID=79078 RepID=A0ABU6VBY5_9FABA|nr:hypothetical protein [Stylosanthes scabra]